MEIFTFSSRFSQYLRVFSLQVFCSYVTSSTETLLMLCCSVVILCAVTWVYIWTKKIYFDFQYIKASLRLQPSYIYKHLYFIRVLYIEVILLKTEITNIQFIYKWKTFVLFPVFLKVCGILIILHHLLIPHCSLKLWFWCDSSRGWCEYILTCSVYIKVSWLIQHHLWNTWFNHNE